MNDRSEGEYLQFKQYDYRANDNLVLEAENRRRENVDGATGESVSLRGRSLPKFGDRAVVQSLPREGNELVEGQGKRRLDAETEIAGETSRLPRKRRKRKTTMLEALEEFDSSQYRPRTEETRQLYEWLLRFAELMLGDQPQDVLRNAVDEMLAVLKDESQNEKEKKESIEQFMPKISDATFAKLLNLSKQINDFRSGEGAATMDTLDENLGVNVVIEENEDEDAQDYYDEENEDDDDGLDDEENEYMNEDSADTFHQSTLATTGEIGDGFADDGNTRDEYLDPATIDAYWLQRQVSQYFSDPNEAKKLSEEILFTISGRDDREVESSLVQLLDFDKFELIRMILKNRFKILYCTRIARASSDEERNKIKLEMMDDPALEHILLELEEGPSALRRRRDAGASSLSGSATSRGFVTSGDIDAGDRNSLKSRSILDFEKIAFEGGSHFMANKKIKLPDGSYRSTKKGYEEIHIPAQSPPDMKSGEELVPIHTMPEWTHPAFKGVKRLNRVQSRLFESAFYGSENLLLCAPTGAGKTNVAMLCILHEIGMHLREDGTIDRDSFKIVYVAPMKALVQEVVQNFSKRLEEYDLTVRELTGDNQLTKAQIEDTQIIVTTPEKWDIVTRKSGDRTYTQLVKLLIIDEIHLLHDERGPILESIVARTLRQIESTQEMIRIVGLSATLPNYADVAAFLRVNMDSGLYHFDNSYRPVPLQQQYIGITERKALKRKQLMDQICYEKVMEQAGKNQTLVFVHSRKETASTGRMIRDLALENDTLALFLGEDAVSRTILQEEAEKIKDASLRELVPYGIAVHHAGLRREDRNLVEDLFADGHLQLLVSTATLAWGVNLPAHCVIIKGTQVYNPEKGRWTELSPLDVMQMMGRAGRPQFDSEGEGIIITSGQELQYYLSLLNQQLPIESQFISRLADHLNAEIVLGTVQNAREAVEWLGYTYLFVRMLKNPSLYDVDDDDLQNDPTLEKRRSDLIHTACVLLDKHNLIKYDKKTGNFQVTDLGRVASHYYISYNSMSIYNDHLKQNMSDIDLFRLFSLSSEFRYMTVREEEKIELQKLLERVPVPVKESLEEPTAKVNVLLQSYLSQLKLEGFALMSDMVYVQQSASRIMRALFEIVLRRNWAHVARRCLAYAKMIDHRMWSSQCPLRQYRAIPYDLIRRIEKKDFPWDRFYDLTPQEIGELVRIPEAGKSLFKYVHKIPKLELAAQVQPITRSLLRVDLTITPDFQYDSKIHGASEPFIVLVEDTDCERILHFETFILKAKYAEDEHHMSFTIPMAEPVPPQYFIRVISDRWLGSETILPVSFRHLILPEKYPPQTELLDLQPLSVSALRDSDVESALYNHIKFFNPIQTQVFTTFYNSDENVLLCAPTGSGKTYCAELAVLRLFRQTGDESGRCVICTPTDAVAEVAFKHWQDRFENKLGKQVVKLTGESAVDLKLIEVANIIVCSAEKWDILSRRWKSRRNVQNIDLFIVDELHLIGGEVGPTLEVVVSRMRLMSSQLERRIRFVGLSSSLSNARDVGEWIGAPSNGIFNFHPSKRPVRLDVHIQSFEQPNFHARMLAMSKPIFTAIKYRAASRPTIVFVPSRRQTRQSTIEFLSFCAAEENPKRFLNCTDSDIAPYAQAVSDETLQQSLEYGVGFLHDGMPASDRSVVEELFKADAIQVLFINFESCWKFDLQAYMVIIAGTQHYDGREHNYVDYPVTALLQMMGRANRPLEYDDAKCLLFCHGPRKEYYKKFIYEPLPVESHLDLFLTDHMNAEVVVKTIENKQEAVDYITWTFLYRRIVQNPNYYNLQGVSHQHLSDYLSELVENTLSALEQSRCIAIEDEIDTIPLNLGMIASYYYIRSTTVEVFGSSLAAKTKLRGLVDILCAASEFDSLPVRHGEEKLLFRLAKHLPLAIDSNRLTDPHTKANVLIQSHFMNRRLIADFREDLHLVLPLATRLLNAMVDVLSSEGWLHPALATMELCQMVVQGLWNKDSILKQLPHFSDEVIGRCQAAGIETIYDVINMEDEERNSVLQMNREELIDVANVCNMYPNVDVAYGVMNYEEQPIVPGENVVVGVELSRDDEDPYIGPVHATRYPGEKDEGWWLVLGDTDRNQLLMVKRVSIGAKTTRAKLQFDAPSEPGHYRYTLFLMSDSYLGCDQEFEVEIDVSAPEGDGGQGDIPSGMDAD